MSAAWLPQFACPECRGPAYPDDEGPWCARCGARFTRVGDVFHFLTPARAEAAAPFLRQYRTVRQREAYRSSAPEYYRMLPCVLPTDPHAAEWRLRRESYAHLQRLALPGVWRGPIRVLDLGAGSGWLSHRLAAFGHRVVAVDRLVDEADGLGACRHYPVPFAAVQADFDALPFAPQQFDLVVFGGSLHYSPDPAATILEASRMLVAGGVLAVMDSPMFARDADGRAMVEQQVRHMEEEYGLTHVVRPGVGFLTFSAIEEATQAVGLRGRFCRSAGSFGWRVRRPLAYVRLRRAPAAFGVWIAR
jgi:SAM-dependent methyltransferase